MAISAPPRQPPRTPSAEPLHGGQAVLVAESSLLLGALTVATVVIAAIVLVVMVRSIGGPSYRATIEDIIPVGSSQVAVEIRVTNLGGSPAAPICQVHMSSAASAYTGESTIKADRPVPAGSSARYSVLVAVTTDGAARVGYSASGVGCR